MFDQTLFEKMPYPIGYLYKEMMQEDDARLKFRGVIKVFAGGLKYLSLIYITDYIQNPTSNKVNDSLCKSLSKPTLGSWVGFIREITNYYNSCEREFSVRELGQFLGRRMNRLLDHMVHVRNLYSHSEVFPPYEKSKQLVDENLPKIQSILESMSFLARYPLIRLDVQHGTEQLMMGASFDLDDSRYYKCVVRAPADVDLDITPFMLIDVDEEFRQLFVYESLVGNRAAYCIGNKLRFVLPDGRPDNRVKLLRELMAKCRSDEKARQERERAAERRDLQEGLSRDTVPIVPLKRLAQKHSEEMLKEYKHSGRYDKSTYVLRKSIQSAYQELFEGDKSGLVIVADSGAGKSTEICRLYVDRLENDFAWILSGRRSSGPSPLSEIGRDLFDGADRDEEQLTHLLRALDRKRTSERFVVVFDGLNETKSPVDAFQCLNDFIEANPYKWLKVIITCRSFAWKAIENCVLPAKHRYVLSADDSVAHILQPFDDDELDQALAVYSMVFESSPERRMEPRYHDYRDRKLLRLPLILRFVFEAFQGRRFPTPLSIETIMNEFTRERIRERDLPFLQQYLMTYFYREESDVLDTWTLSDAQIDGSNMDPMEREAYEKLAEHIWGEQVDTIDELWVCPDQSCENSGRPVLFGDAETLRCPECQELMSRQNFDNRSTYSRLLAESILSENESAGHVFVRLVYDRYFDYLMRRFCLVEKMHERHDPQVVEELFQKSKRSAIFIEPLKGVILELWRKEEPSALYQVAAKDNFTAYEVLNEVFAEFAEADFPGFARALRTVVEATDFNINICRSGVHALLADPETAQEHGQEIVDLLVLLSHSASEKPQEDAAEYLVDLRRRRVDLMSPLARQCAEIFMKQLRVTRLTWIAVSARKWRHIKGLFWLYFYTLICGLGNFFDDEVFRTMVFKDGLAILHRVLRNPLLAVTQRLWVRFISRKFANIYKEKGPLPCNYWEMLFQLRQDPEEIRRVSELFFVENRNLFDLDYVKFQDQLHSENGLITWYILSALPLHYARAQNATQAVDYMRKFAREGTEMDRYVIGQASAIILGRPEVASEEIEELLSEIGRMILEQPHHIFLHPEPVVGLTNAEEVAKHNQERVAQIRKSTHPYMVPWITVENDVLHRFYLNTVLLHAALLHIRREKPVQLDFILDLIERNCDDDLLRFGGDLQAGRRFVICYLIQALGIARLYGFVNVSLATIDTIIRRYIEQRRDPVNVEVYEYALCETLKSIKETYRNEVLGFIERYNLNRPEFSFLDEVRKATGEQHKLFNMSIYGGNIYESGFSNKTGREAFGAFTKLAADARDVDEFFDIYADHLVDWLKTLTLQNGLDSRPAD